MNLRLIIQSYQKSFQQKEYSEKNENSDLLMDLFGITSSKKNENKQYWGRELGMLFEKLTINIFENIEGYKTKEKIGERDYPFDFIYKNMAIDTKYRIGSGDSGTLKKFKQYGKLLKDMGYEPVILILRTDSLPAAINACKVGGWKVYQGKESYNFIKNNSNFDFEQYLKNNINNFKI